MVKIFTSKEIHITESISSNRFVTRSRINALTAHVQVLLLFLKQAALDRLQVHLNVILFMKNFSSI